MKTHYYNDSTGYAQCGSHSLGMIFVENINDATCKKCRLIITDGQFPAEKRTNSLFEGKLKCKKYRCNNVKQNRD